MLTDVVELYSFAEAGDIGVISCVLVTAPRVVGSSDLGYVVITQFAVNTVNQRSHLPSVDEEGLAPPISEASIPLIASEEPEADRNLGRVEKLSRQGDHAVHEVGFDDLLS